MSSIPSRISRLPSQPLTSSLPCSLSLPPKVECLSQPVPDQANRLSYQSLIGFNLFSLKPGIFPKEDALRRKLLSERNKVLIMRVQALIGGRICPLNMQCGWWLSPSIRMADLAHYLYIIFVYIHMGTEKNNKTCSHMGKYWTVQAKLNKCSFIYLANESLLT